MDIILPYWTLKFPIALSANTQQCILFLWILSNIYYKNRKFQLVFVTKNAFELFIYGF